MSKRKTGLNKQAKKQAKKELQVTISTKLSEAISFLGIESKKIKKEITKATKKIARKVAKDFKPVKALAAPAADTVAEPVESTVPATSTLNQPVAKASAPAKATRPGTK